jgi:hypothetical protein
MYKLRFAQLDSEIALPRLKKHYNAIQTYLQENEEEAAWWTEGQGEPAMIQLEGGISCISHEWLIQ